MTLMLWSKMPSRWISEGKMREHFSSGNKVSDDIAALKVFIVLCFFAKQVNRDNGYRSTDVFEAKATYDQLTEMCSLSRALVSRGLKKLKLVGLLKSTGVRNKTYTFEGGAYKGWCKLPKRAIVKNEEKIPSLAAIHNRYTHERNALKLFLYLLASRSNRNTFVDLCRGTIAKQTGIPLDEIDGALGFLRSISLVSKVEDKGFLANSIHRVQEERLHRYWVVGSESLNYKTYSVESGDSEFVRHPELYAAMNNPSSVGH
ncbi:hypothetical protein K5N70_003766 [Vibrio vulnificus]|nr:hypothetical protein [Vibrio vulnificus]